MGFSSSGRKRRPRIRRIISTGTIVIARIDENVNRQRLGIGERAKHPPLLRFEQKNRQE